MKRLTRLFLIVIILAVSASGCQQATDKPTTLSDEDISAIKNTIQTFVKADLDGDWDTFFAQFDENSVWMWPNHPAVENLEKIKKLNLARAIKKEMLIEEIDGRVDLAYVRCSLKLLLDFEGAVELQHKSLIILRKQSDGRWLISIIISNSDLPDSGL